MTVGNTYVATLKQGSALALPASGVETVLLTTVPVVFNNPGGPGNVVDGTVELTPGTGSTTATVRVRQGTLTGVLVDATPAVAVTAGVPISLPFTMADLTALGINSPNGLQYVVTVQTAGTSAAGSAYGTVAVTAATTAS